MRLNTALGFVRRLNAIADELLCRARDRQEPGGDGWQLELASCCRFLRVQTRHMMALHDACEAGGFDSGRVLMRAIYEGAVRFAWLVRNAQTRAERVDRWLNCWILEQLRVAAELKSSDETIQPIREHARALATWIPEDDWNAILEMWETGRRPTDTAERARLIAYVDAYSGTSLGAMKATFLQTLPTPMRDAGRHYKVDYTLMSMVQHWTPLAVMRPLVKTADGRLATDEPRDEDIVDTVLRPTIFLFAVFLNDFGAVSGMDVDPLLDTVDRDFGAAFRAEVQMTDAGPAED